MNLVWAMVITLWSYGAPYQTILYQTFPNDKAGYHDCMSRAHTGIIYTSDPGANQTNECKEVYIQVPVPLPN
jgi:hypothetical protein